MFQSNHLIGFGVSASGPPEFMSATGGNTIAEDGDYKVHTFTSSGTFTPTLGTDPTYGDVTDYLVIAGGAGGGSPYGGGAGAGGYRNSFNSETSGGGGSSETLLTVLEQAYTITIGGGGAVGVTANGINGTNSV